ncbi:MAG: hypothetical protein LBJ00_06025 [Planctomycetaceae bacterium]|jgi:hypothetical protein|nr:hypothetical protein [Planctomycetaceae bacterium]
MNFSPITDVWLQSHSTFVNAAYNCSAEAGRSLGPASGNVWEVYPFVAPNPFTGLFAGLSIAGLDSPDFDIRLLEYSSNHGFIPTTDGDFTGDNWQRFTAEDWVKITQPENCTPCNIVPPKHDLDLKLQLTGQGIADTRDWVYSSVSLSENYTQHCWVCPTTPNTLLSSLTILAVTFDSLYETRSPFLRPCYVTGEAMFDPATLFPVGKVLQLFNGTVILADGANITLSTSGESSNGEVLISHKPLTEMVTDWLQTLVNLKPLSGGDIPLASPNCYKFVQFYDEVDTEQNITTLEDGTLYVENICPPCCNCADYVKAYEVLRTLTARQEAVVRQYNVLYQQINSLREELGNYVDHKTGT